MSQVSEVIRKHHAELIKKVNTHVKALIEGQPDANPQELSDFLKEELLPHAMGEERHLYPTVDPLIKIHSQPTATMSVDHEFIENYIRRIGETTAALQSTNPERQPVLQRQLQHLALQLEAILRLHLEKEERIYLPLFEEHLSQEEQQRVLEGMHAA